MGKISKKLVVSGYYGFGNSGDEAVLQSILLALQNEAEKQQVRIEPIVLSIQPEETSATYGVQAVHRMKIGQIITALRSSDGLISGGGSLLQDATGLASIPYYLGVVRLAQWLGKPTFVYSQGIGPVNRQWFYPWICGAFSRAQYVSVRDKASASLLEQMGVMPDRLHVVPDPVMGLPLWYPDGEAHDLSTGDHRPNRPTIGVSVRYWNADRSDLDSLAAALNGIRTQCDAEIRFLPFHHPADLEASRYVMNKMELAPGESSVQVIDHITHPQKMLAQVGACRLLIGMRLHSLIYAATQQVPMIGISYDPKIDHFLQQLGMRPAASTGSFSTEAVVSQALQLWNNQEQWKRDTGNVIEQLRDNAQKPAQEIIRFLCREG